MINKKLQKILDKSLVHRNYEAAKRLDQMEALKRWANEPIPELPKYEKPKVVKHNAGFLNLFKDVLLQLKP